MTSRAWAGLIALAAVWGSSYLFIRIAVEDVGPFLLAFVRVAGAALVLSPVLIRHRAALRGRWHLVPVVALPQAAIPFTLISAGERHIPSGLAAILVAAVPLWLVVLSPLLRLPRPTVRSVLGLLVGLLGVGILVGGVDGGPVNLTGALLVLLAAGFYAVGATFVKKYMTGVPPVPLTAALMTGSAVALFPFALFDLPARMPSGGSIGALATLAVVCTAAAFVIYNRLIAGIGPQSAALVAYFAPAFAVLYGAVLLSEPVGIGAVAGLGLILLGSWLSASRKAAPSATMPSDSSGSSPDAVRTREVGNPTPAPARPLR